MSCKYYKISHSFLEYLERKKVQYITEVCRGFIEVSKPENGSEPKPEDRSQCLT